MARSFTKIANFKLPVVISVALVLCHQVVNISGRSRGAPVTSCRSLTPAHGYPPQTSEPPYVVTAQPSLVYHNQTITVTIRTMSGMYRFKGFVVQAKETAYWKKYFQPAIGTFLFTEGTQRLNCYYGEHNTVTHSHAVHTEEVILTWKPPYKYHGRVTFMASVVATFKKYWIRVHSNTVTIV